MLRVLILAALGHHSKKATQAGELTSDYDQLDIELWFVVRLSSHSI